MTGKRRSSAPPPPLRWRDREWRWLAACAAVLAVWTALWPELDLIVAAWFAVDGQFPARQWPWLQLLYELIPWLGRGFALMAVLLWLRPRWPTPHQRRRLLALGLATWLGVGVVVNGALKEGWGRARPAPVLAGEAVFTPALRPAAQCRTNCSFVSGHAATGFVLAAVGVLGAPRARRRWLWIGMMAGGAIGLMRMAQGAHFLSDVLYCGLVIWACNLVLRALWLRRQARRRVSGAAAVGPGPTRAWFRTGGR